MKVIFADGSDFDPALIKADEELDWYLFGKMRKSDPWVFMDSYESLEEVNTASGIEGMQFDAPKYMVVKHKSAFDKD